MSELLQEFYKTTFKIDPILAAAKAPIQKEMAKYREYVTKAVKFTLGDDAMHHIVVRGTQDHTKLPQRVPLACLPYETVWLEYDNHTRIRAQHSIGTSDLPDDRTPRRAGFLLRRVYDRPTAWTATKVFDPRSGLNGLSSLVYLFDAESDRPIHMLGPWENMADRSVPHGASNEELMIAKRGLNYPLWGYAQINSHDEMLSKLLNHAAYAMEPAYFSLMDIMLSSGKWSQKTTTKIITESVNENAGDMRFLTTALALINEVPVTFTDETRQGSFLAGGRPHKFFSNSVITLNIPAMKRRTVMQFLDRAAAKAAKRKRHRVRGHWRTADTPRGALWEMYVDHETGQTRYRRWIEHHLRGDASMGWVNQEYNVKTQKISR